MTRTGLCVPMNRDGDSLRSLDPGDVAREDADAHRDAVRLFDAPAEPRTQREANRGRVPGRDGE